jgi:hypothetical protein
MNSCYIRYDHDHYTTSTTHAPITDLLSCVPEQSHTANPNRYVTWEIQSFHQRINITRLMSQGSLIQQHSAVTIPWYGLFNGRYFTSPASCQRWCLAVQWSEVRAGKAYNCQTKCLWTMHLMWLLSQVSLQCENKFIASFPLGLGNGLG